LPVRNVFSPQKATATIAPAFGVPKQELPLVASVSDMPNLPGDVVSLGSGHT
jgi:hypothetical protein